MAKRGRQQPGTAAQRVVPEAQGPGARRPCALQGLEALAARRPAQHPQRVLARGGPRKQQAVLPLAGEAAHALLAADDVARAARGEPADESASAGADVVGADPLLRLLARKSALAAPVEAAQASKALLAALSALDELVDALTPDQGIHEDAG